MFRRGAVLQSSNIATKEKERTKYGSSCVKLHVQRLVKNRVYIIPVFGIIVVSRDYDYE